MDPGSLPTSSSSPDVSTGSRRHWVRSGDFWAALVLAGLSGIALLELWRSGRTLWSISGPGPAFFPAILAVILLSLAVGLALKSVRTDPDLMVDEPTEAPAPMPQTLAFAGLVAGMIFLFPVVGGLVAIGLFVFVEAMIVERRRVLPAIAASIGTTALVYVLFVWLLGVRLPSGILG